MNLNECKSNPCTSDPCECSNQVHAVGCDQHDQRVPRRIPAVTTGHRTMAVLGLKSCSVTSGKCDADVVEYASKPWFCEKFQQMSRSLGREFYMHCCQLHRWHWQPHSHSQLHQQSAGGTQRWGQSAMVTGSACEGLWRHLCAQRVGWTCWDWTLVFVVVLPVVTVRSIFFK
jgi:hypothetical protein